MTESRYRGDIAHLCNQLCPYDSFVVRIQGRVVLNVWENGTELEIAVTELGACCNPHQVFSFTDQLCCANHTSMQLALNKSSTISRYYCNHAW